MIKNYFYKLLAKYLSLYIRPDNSVIEINPFSKKLACYFTKAKVLFSRTPHYVADAGNTVTFEETLQCPPDYILLNGNLHYERDIQAFLTELQQTKQPSTRLIIL